MMKLRDLGLSYEEAAHGIQTAIAHAMNSREYGYDEYNATEPKHLRVGVDLSKSDQCGLATLLMDKGVITLEEYLEAVRLAANEELARWETTYGGVIHFR